MSQIPEQYYVFLKLHESFLRMCDVSMKALEIIEKENGVYSTKSTNIQNQMTKLVIENLNLFQDIGIVEQIKGQKIMNKKIMDNNEVEIKIGDNAEISGEIVVSKSIDNSFNKVNSSTMPNELKVLLKELSIAIDKIVENLSKDDAKDVAEDLNNLVEQTTREEPKRNRWSVSIEGLSKAAKKVGSIGIPVLELISKIVPLLEKISK